MQWIKAHLTIVVCGAVSVAAIVLMVLGIMMSDVQEALARGAGVVQNLTSARPVNQRVIQLTQKILEQNAAKIETMNKQLTQLGSYQPLIEDVFPAINQSNPGARFRFKQLLLEAQDQMIALLRAGPCPTQQEYTDEQAFIDDQKLKAAGAAGLGVTESAGRTPTPAIAAPGPRSSIGATGRVDMEQRQGLSPEQLAETFGDVRASIRRARSIYCYVDSKADVFGSWPGVTGSQDPSVESMWYAQMGLWLEQDVVKALASLNNRVAEAIKTRQEDPWVGVLPVKHLKRITINGYVSSGTVPAGESSTSAGKPGDMIPAFYTRPSVGEQVDVIQFTVELVVEARLLPSVIDEICKAGFFTLLMVNYSAVEANENWVGHIYGPAPTINVILDFDGCFTRANYEKWLPPSVKVAIAAGNSRFEQSGAAPASPAGGGRLFTPPGRPGVPGGFRDDQ
ncbi:MAG TPA: hypothetical protein VLM89_14315 [Phycisphaerae bacterium]|nr:hypothetical protein [Phycisphaerae bacterium]